MFTITKKFDFCAAHSLPEMPDGHKCKRYHGHNYLVTVELQAQELDEYGFVEDYGNLDDIKQYIDQTLDHRDLREIFGGMFNTTTAERLAESLYRMFIEKHPRLTAVTVSETPKTSATFRP